MFTLLALLIPAAQAVPMELNHTGRLIDVSGLPLQGPHNLTVALFDASGQGTELWSETTTALDFDNGYFMVELGADTSNPLDTTTLDRPEVYIEVAVDGVVVGTRQRLRSVPYALRAGVASSVDGGVVNASEILINNKPVIDTNGALVGDDALTGLGCSTSGQVAVFDGSIWSCALVDWANLANLPTGFTDGIDNDTLATTTCAAGELLAYVGGVWSCQADQVLDDATVDAYVENGPLNLATNTTLDGAVIATGLHYTDADARVAVGPHTADTLTGLGCTPDQIARYDGNAWGCITLDASLIGALDLAGGTLSGTLSGTDASFSGDLAVGSGASACGGGVGAGTLRWDGSALLLCDGTQFNPLQMVSNDGSSPTSAASDCLDLHTNWPSLGDGSYWINPAGSNAYQAYCDMSTNGGGWTLVANISDTGTDLWSQFMPAQNTGLWEDTSTLGTAPSFTSDYKSTAYLEVSATDLLIKEAQTNVLEADACLPNATFRDFIASLSWAALGSDSDWTDASGAYRCNYVDFGYNDPVLRASSQATKELGFKWGELDGVQDGNKDRTMITTYNANGLTHHVDLPTGLGGFTAYGTAENYEDANECQGDGPDRCTNAAQDYQLFVR